MSIKHRIFLMMIAAVLTMPSVVFSWSSDTSVNTPIAVATDDQASAVMVEDGAGGAIIAWTDYRNSDDRDIYAQRVDATGAVQWTINGVAVSTAPDSQYSIHMVSDGNGGAFIAWSDKRSGSLQLFVQRIAGNGVAQWASNGVLVAATPHSYHYLDLIGDGDGGVFLVWKDSAGGAYIQQINAVGEFQRTGGGELIAMGAPSITSDGSGGAIVNWGEYAQRYNVNGEIQWADGGVLVTADTDLTRGGYDIVSDGAGGAIIFLERYDTGFSYYVQKINAAGEIQWPEDVWLTSDLNSISDTRPMFISDGQGGALVSWWVYRENNVPFDPNELAIYVQGVDTDGNLRWSPDGLLVGHRPYGSGRDRVPIISDNAGGFIATWAILDGNYIGDIYAQHFNTEGLPQWGTDPVAICTNPANQVNPAIAGDGSGGAIFVWMDYRNGDDDEDLYAHKISADGGSAGIQTPSNVSPLDGAYIDVTPTLGASVFVDDSGLLGHAASQWRINNTGTVTPETPEQATSGDESYFTYQLPFTFIFFERNITSISVNTNGLIELLEDGETDYANSRYATHFDGEHIDNMDAIFAANDDLDLINGYLRLYNAGTHVVIEWYGDTYLDADADPNYPDVTNSMLFQVVLHQDGKIIWNFSQLDFIEFEYDMYSGVYPNGGSEISMISGSLADITTPSAFEFNPVTRAITPATYNWFVPQPVIYDSGESTDLLSHLVPGTVVLEDAVTYYWGVRHMGDNNEWSLWSTPTSFIADLLPPAVSSTVPADAGIDIAVNTVISATFSKDMDVNSIGGSSFTLTGPDGSVAGTVSYDAMTASFTPLSDLSFNTSYTATITASVTDTLGRHLALPEVWGFKTGLEADLTSPDVETVLPTGLELVAIDIGSISATFSESINAATVNGTSLTLTSSAGAVAGTVSYDAATKTARFDPDALFTYSTEYTVTITTAIQDNAGNSMELDYPWTFTTADAPPPPPAQDPTPPRVVSVTPTFFPVPAAIGSITATFSEPIQLIDTTSFVVRDSSWGVVPGTVQYDAAAMTAWFYPTTDLEFSTPYTVTISSALIRDLADNTMEQDREWSFTTGADPATAGCDPETGNTSGCESFDAFTYGTGVEVNTYGSSITGLTAEYAARRSVSLEESFLDESEPPSSFFESQAVARVDATSFRLRSRSRRMETSDDLAGAWSMGASKIEVKGVPPGTVIPMSIVVSGNFTGLSGTLMLQVRDFDKYRMLGSVTVTGSGQPFTYDGTTFAAVTYQQMIDPYGNIEDASNYVKTTANGSSGYRLDFLYPVVPNNGIYIWFVAGVKNYDDVQNAETDFTATLEVNPPSGVTVTLASGQVFTSAVDTDGDGVSDLEDSSPNNAAIASPEAATGTGSISVDVSGNAGASLSQVKTLDEDDWELIQDNKPPGVDFPDGLVSFRLNGVEPGSTVFVTLTYPTEFPENAVYYKVNETGFYEFGGATISGNTVTLELTDGADGDADGIANGVIVDPGGVGVPPADTSSAGGDDDWLDGCFIMTINPGF